MATSILLAAAGIVWFFLGFVTGGLLVAAVFMKDATNKIGRP